MQGNGATRIQLEGEKMNKRIRLAASISGAVALLGLGIGGAITGGSAAQASSTNSIGGAGATAVQENGGGGIPATSVVVSASPVFKAIPPCGFGAVYTCGIP
jgi:hypothetical protein